jgi:hypothetical protein
MADAIVASLSLKGWDRLDSAFRSAPNQTMNAVSFALTRSATSILNEALTQVPFRRGTLSSTGTVAPVAMLGGGQLAVRIFFGGAAAPYAEEQHDNLNYRHAPGRKALYLSDPVKTHLPMLDLQIRSSIGRALSRLGF